MKRTIHINPLLLSSFPKEPDGSIKIANVPPNTILLACRDFGCHVEIDIEIPDDGPDITTP